MRRDPGRRQFYRSGPESCAGGTGKGLENRELTSSNDDPDDFPYRDPAFELPVRRFIIRLSKNRSVIFRIPNNPNPYVDNKVIVLRETLR